MKIDNKTVIKRLCNALVDYEFQYIHPKVLKKMGLGTVAAILGFLVEVAIVESILESKSKILKQLDIKELTFTDNPANEYPDLTLLYNHQPLRIEVKSKLDRSTGPGGVFPSISAKFQGLRLAVTDPKIRPDDWIIFTGLKYNKNNGFFTIKGIIAIEIKQIKSYLMKNSKFMPGKGARLYYETGNLTKLPHLSFGDTSMKKGYKYWQKIKNKKIRQRKIRDA